MVFKCNILQFFFKKKIANDVAYFDYLFINNITKDHSVLSDITRRAGWGSHKGETWSGFFNYDLPDGDMPNQQFFSQTRRMQGIPETGFNNTDSEELDIEDYQNKSTFSQPGEFVPLVYDTNPLEDTQFIEKSSSLYRLHWISFLISLSIYFFEIVFLFLLIFNSLDFYIVFDGFCWNLFELSIMYPSRFIWFNFNIGSYLLNIYDFFPIIFKIIILFLWHLWYYSKFFFIVFGLVFLNFIVAFYRILFFCIHNIFLKAKNLDSAPSTDGYFGDFTEEDFSEKTPEFMTKGSSMFSDSDNNDGIDVPTGEPTDIGDGSTEDEDLADDFFLFYKDNDSLLKMRPVSEFVFFFKSFVLIMFFFFWYIFLFLFVIFTLNYFFFSVFRFTFYDDVYKYTLFNYFFGHINFFPLLDWFYQFEIKIKKAYNQKFFLERYTNYIFAKGFSKLHFFFINQQKDNSSSLKKMFKEINKFSKNIYLPRRLKGKRYFYKSLTPFLSDIDKYFKKGIASKRLLFDFVYFKKYTSFQNKVVFLSTKDNVNYYTPNKTRLWLINTRFKDFFTYMYDLFTGSFFFSYTKFTNFKFFTLDDLTVSRLLQVGPQDDHLYSKELMKKTVIFSHYYDRPVTKASSLLRAQNRTKTVSDIFLEDFLCNGRSETPEVFYGKAFYNKNKSSVRKIIQEYYNYVFLQRNSFKKEFFNNFYRLNFKFEELFESLEHETDLFFDFSKRNLNAADISNYLKTYWKQYTVLRQHKVNKIKTTMKINNFFIRSRLQFLKIFTKFNFLGLSFLYKSDEQRKLYEAFSYYNIKYLKKFLRFYGLFQFNSILRRNKYLLTTNLYYKFDLIKLKYFRNLELWKIFQFRTPFQSIFNRLNSRSFIGYYCNSNNTFPFVPYRDHFKSQMPGETAGRLLPFTYYVEEKKVFSEEEYQGSESPTLHSGALLRKKTPLNYIFFFENDSWRNYKYSTSQKLLDNAPKFLASSGFFNSYYFIVKYLPKETFKNKTNVNFIYNRNYNNNFIYKILGNFFKHLHGFCIIFYLFYFYGNGFFFIYFVSFQ